MRQRKERLLRSVWLFPVILFAIVLVLAAGRISGSSIGSYHPVIYGQNAEDPDLFFGYPRPIRSDEWLVTTQLTIAQSKADFPRINENLGTGTDMSLIGDAPYKEWSVAFKPQNLAYLAIPLENALAFKWWFLLFMLITSFYFFTLRFFPSKRLFASVFASAAGLSPFVSWWFVTGTIAPLFYGLLVMILGMRIINGEPVKFLDKRKPLYSHAIYALVLAYLLTAFALIIYPPFQIPVAIVVFFFLLGYLINKRLGGKVQWKKLLVTISVFTAGLVVTMALLFTFISTRQDAVKALTGTVYPAQRTSLSGGLNPLHIFDSFMMPQLQSESRGTQFFKNQSEASNFILLSPFLILPALVLTYIDYRKNRRIDWLFTAILACTLLLFARSFIPIGDPLYNILLLHLVPHERLLIGIGLANVIFILLILKKLGDLKLPTRPFLIGASIYSLICFAAIAWLGFKVSDLYPKFISYPPKIIILALAFSGILFLVLTRRMLLAAIVLLAFSFFSVVKVNPIYQGLGWIDNNELLTKMQSVSAPEDTWAVADTIQLENLGLLANRDSLTGVHIYPDLAFWDRAAPGGSDIYNRYAHILFISSPSFEQQLYLVQPDFFEIGLSCNEFVTKNVDFLLTTVPLDRPCLELTDRVSYPAITFFIHKVKSS
ncbi:hypothetical protein A3E49_02560 [Candidatus Saccharibacteria bacterium RIFCSPHIGHO2_12_FULL_49_19]|nr:MAG: hypothetical protein A3E49_02560 [Candidatus Saccharibacteria bacterium RIFCSPHIGHO2_12_FULL_49_19]